jgi:hypothetical protein
MLFGLSALRSIPLVNQEIQQFWNRRRVQSKTVGVFKPDCDEAQGREPTQRAR